MAEWTNPGNLAVPPGLPCYDAQMTLPYIHVALRVTPDKILLGAQGKFAQREDPRGEHLPLGSHLGTHPVTSSCPGTSSGSTANGWMS